MPIFGALGRISWLGTSISSLYTAANAASIVTPMTRPLASSMSPGCSTNFSSGKMCIRDSHISVCEETAFRMRHKLLYFLEQMSFPLRISKTN